MITVKEAAWFIEIDLADDPELKMFGLDLMGGAGLILAPETVLETFYLLESYKKLSALATYQLKVFDREAGSVDDDDDDDELPLQNERPKKKSSGDPVREETVNVAQIRFDDQGHPLLLLPKAKLTQAERVLKSLGLEYSVQRREYPMPKMQAVFKTYPNPARLRNPDAPERIRLENLQIDALMSGLLKRQPGAFVYAMGGGKSVLVAALLSAFPTLRPAIVTSAASGDSQQLAAKIAQLTGAKVKLVGCKSGALTPEEKKMLFVKTKDADVIVGSHKMFERLNPEKARMLKGAAALLVEKIATAKIVIVDEAHECTTEKRLSALTRTNPEIAFALTATWLKNWSKADQVLADLLNCEAKELCDVTHQQVEETGRVTPTELFGYNFDRNLFPIPEEAANSYRGFGFMQQEVEFHPSRNRYLAQLCNHLMDVNAREQRGCILAFANTIGHAKKVVKELCRLRDIPYKESEMEMDSIFLFNAQIPEAEKTRRMRAMAEGRTRIVFATETLSRGIDMNTIYDVVDLTGSSKIVQLIQKSGRSVRPDGDQKVARVHFVMEMDIPGKEGKDKVMLRKISEKKKRELEAYFGRLVTTLTSNLIPWAPRPETLAGGGLNLRAMIAKAHAATQNTHALPAGVSGS